jgi:hypothetical protein
MKILYDEEGDLLEVQFKAGVPTTRTGIGLTDHITIFCDTAYQQALGVTAMAYSKLLSLPKSPMNELAAAPSTVQHQVKRLLAQAPLNRILYVEGDKIGLEDVRISELAM